MKKSVVLSLLLLCGLVGYLLLGKQAEPMPEGSASAARLVSGPYEVAHFTEQIVDSSRPTPANGDYLGSDERSFTAYIWHPKEAMETPGPMLIYSHGFMSTGEGGRYLAEHLASKGYVVAAPSYPLSHFDAPGGPTPEDIAQQPRDARYLIDELLRRNDSKGDALFGRIDPEQIAAAGLSLGGMTTELLAFRHGEADERLKAAVSIAGPSYMFDRHFFASRDLPFLMIASPIDAMVDYQQNARPILAKVPGSLLLTIDGAAHAAFSDTAKWLRWFDNADSIGCDSLMENIDLTASQGWYATLGDPSTGVLNADPPAMCSMNPLPSAMNVLRQHQINTLAVTAFLDCHVRGMEQACSYIRSGIAGELPEVTVESGQAREVQ